MSIISYIKKVENLNSSTKFPDNTEYLSIMFSEDREETLGECLAEHAGSTIRISGIGSFEIKLCNYDDRESKIALSKQFRELVEPYFKKPTGVSLSAWLGEIIYNTPLPCNR